MKINLFNPVCRYGGQQSFRNVRGGHFSQKKGGSQVSDPVNLLTSKKKNVD